MSHFAWLDRKLNHEGSLVFRGARAAVTLSLIFFLYPTVKEQFIYFQF
jgi:hypothetical protein